MARIVFILIGVFVTFYGFGQQRLYKDKETGGISGGLVGSIDGEFNVSPSGQASYVIPISALAGTGGVKPNISLQYNSSTKNGLLGYGFDLTGLSIISRTPSNRYIDGFSGSISLSRSDNFAIDGVRLIKRDSQLSDTCTVRYLTEANDFSKIESEGLIWNPDKFTVHTKSGLTYEYKPVNSILKGDDDVSLFWLVTKVRDTAGNYYTIAYEGDAATNDFRVKRINYTGNNNTMLLPYASVRFVYTEDIYAPTTFIYGRKVRKGNILSRIELYYGDKRIHYYQMTYHVVNRKSLLKNITEFADDGSSLNPTELEWHTVNDFNVANVNYSRTNSIHKANVTVGDFNGDGKSDIIVVPENSNAGWSGWKVFLGDKTYLIESGEDDWKISSNEIAQTVCGDFNADGLTDIVIKRKFNSSKYYCDLYLASVVEGKIKFTYNKTLQTYPENDFSIQVVELDGDCATDIFLWCPGSGKCYIYRSETNGNEILPLNKREERKYSFNWDRVEFGDFNGDGRTDALNLREDGYDLLTVLASGSGSYVNSGSWPGKNHVIYFGDYNGDGKTDMLLTGMETLPNSGSWSNWCFLYSKGDNSFERVYKPRKFDAHDKKFFIGDFNGDGYDDIHVVDKTSGSSLKRPKVYLNDGNSDFFAQKDGGLAYGLDKWRFYMGDFNGDGKTDFLCTSDWVNSNWDGYQLYLMPEGCNNLLKSITDGLGNRTEIFYKSLSDKEVFKKGTTVEYPIVSCGMSWPVVSSVTVPDGVGGRAEQRYEYANALMHQAGLGLLCFESFTVKDISSNTKTVNTYEVNRKRYAVGQKETNVYINDRLVSKTEYVNVLNNKYLPYGKDRVYTYFPSEIRQRAFEYNSRDTISDIITTTEYDNYGNQIRINSISGDNVVETVNTFKNDEAKWHLGRLSESTVTKRSRFVTNVRTARFNYDSRSGLLISEVTEPDDSELGFKKDYTRNAHGNITKSVVTPNDGGESRTSESKYDSKGRFIVSTVDALGFTTTNVIDEELGTVLATEDEAGLVTSNVYNRFGRLEETSTAISKSVHTTGWASGMEDAPSGALTFEYSRSKGDAGSLVFYDCVGRVLRNIVDSFNGKSVYTDYIYNSKGQLWKTSEPYYKGDPVYWNENEYDAAGRTIKQIYADGNYSTIEYSGFKTVVTDPLGHTSTKITDIHGRLAESIDHNGTSIKYVYDCDGNCIQIAGPRVNTIMEYDLAGNRTWLDTPDLGLTLEKYNAFGELVSRQDSYGKTTFEYDKGGRVVKETRPDCVITTIYDSHHNGSIYGKNVKYTDKTLSRVEYDYDKYGRVTGEHIRADGEVYSIYLKYSDTGKVDRISYPGGLKIKNEYDSCGVLIKVSNAASGDVYWTLDSLDARGGITSEKFGNGKTVKYIYNPYTGRLEGIKSDISRLPAMRYWFDAVGNLTSRQRGTNTPEEFVYDALNRLVKVNPITDLRVTVRYDAAGNITYKSDVGYYNYEEGTNRLISITECVTQPKVWDEIQYNSRGKIKYVKSGERCMHLYYGPDGERVKQEIGDIRKYYIGKLYELVVKGEEKTGVNYIFAGGKMVAMVETKPGSDAKVAKYVHHDHLGSVMAVTDQAGNLIEEFSYDAWGRRRNPVTLKPYSVIIEAEASLDRGFGGHEHIDGFEMVNMNGRMYDPVVGRFLSADPYVQMADFTQSLNRYAYCVNNPLSLIDPSGYSWFSRHWKMLTASIVGIVVSAVTLGSGSGLGAVIIAGAAGGAASALTGALLNGANIGQIAKATFTGGVLGAAGAFLNFGAADPNLLISLFKHSFSQGWLEGITGGNFFHGAVSGAVAKGGGALMEAGGQHIGQVGRLIANSVLSGTLDELGGGKFANGAITGAFSYLFNEIQHRVQDRGDGDDDEGVMGTAVAIAVTASAIDGPMPIGDIVGGIVLCGAAVYDIHKTIHLTYVLRHPDGRVYVGRTSGVGSQEKVFRNRFYKHRKDPEKEGFVLDHIDKVAQGPFGYAAIRGREQQLIDFYGGIGSPKIINIRRGVWYYNIRGLYYHGMSNAYFGQLYRYTGFPSKRR
ncbi:MAG: FG-GAP-like repeat-containing protein [Muribaculaceae bacterium]|nr:FG-GAP-like repeat-containing protein [Muribaculaceae bacterium]